jgi:hypothetical protein
MRRFWWPMWLGAAVLLSAATAAVWFYWSRTTGLPKPANVPAGDQEIAWIYTSSSADAWAQFVIGLKRTEMTGSGLTVDVSHAFPEQSTDIPEIAIRRATHVGTLHVRWYKTASDATAEQWIEGLALRDPAPLAVVGGSSSDQAYRLAVALNRTPVWVGDRPLLLITSATAETLNVDPDDPTRPPSNPSRAPVLMNVYPGRSFRFCYTNRQMAAAVIDYVVRDLTLMPGSVGWPGFRTLGAGVVGAWPAVGGLADLASSGPAVFAVEWEDDLYSEDLANSFKDAIEHRLTAHFDPTSLPRPNNAPVFIRDCIPLIPYSVGGFWRPNPEEAVAVQEIAARLRPPGNRSVLIVPTGSSAPARRVLLALAERVPLVGRRVVAVTGDGIGVNTIYRDAEFAWPARSIPIQFVMFAHANPFGWDAPGGPTPPQGYELKPKNSTQDVLAFNELGRIVIDAAFPVNDPGGVRVAGRADELMRRLRAKPGEGSGYSHRTAAPFFADNGDRHDPSGEHVVVLRPTFRYGTANPSNGPDAVIEVHRPGVDGWVLVASVPVVSASAGNGDCPK